MKASKVDVLLEIVLLVTQLVEGAPNLVFERGNVAGKQPAQAEGMALGVGEASALVEDRIVEQCPALDRLPAGRGDP